MDVRWFHEGEYKDARAALILRVNELLADAGPSHPISVLEAGGGAYGPLPIKVPHKVTTIDISPEQIEKNTYAEKKYCGDLEVFDYGDQRFDLVLCHNVIEHLARPEQAIRKFCAATNEGGLVLIAAPDRRSMRSLATRFSPHWFHVQYYRRVMGRKTAGQPGYAPFPTHLRPVCSLNALTDLLQDLGFEIAYASSLVNLQVEALRRKFAPAYHAYKAASKLTTALTAGAAGQWHTDFAIIARRRGDRDPQDRTGARG